MRALIVTLLAGCATAPAPPVRGAELRPRSVPVSSGQPEVAPRPGFDELVQRERVWARGEGLALVAELPAEPSVHLVLRAGLCYGLSAVGEEALRLALADEHGRQIGAVSGRAVRIWRICPRWTGSFVLRIEARGSRSWVALFSAQPSSIPAASGEMTDSIARCSSSSSKGFCRTRPGDG